MVPCAKISEQGANRLEFSKRESATHAWLGKPIQRYWTCEKRFSRLLHKFWPREFWENFTRAHARTVGRAPAVRVIFSPVTESGKFESRAADTRRQATPANGRENEPVNCTSLMTGPTGSVFHFSERGRKKNRRRFRITKD